MYALKMNWINIGTIAGSQRANNTDEIIRPPTIALVRADASEVRK